MKETHQYRILMIKTLAIIGFLVTLGLVVWLIVAGLRLIPGAFSSLASIAESIKNYRPLPSLELTLEKTAVDSGESFELHWTDMGTEGTFHFSYGCTDGVGLGVRGQDGVFVPIRCTDSLGLPADVHGLFLSVTSDAMRVADVPLTLSYENDAKHVTKEAKATVTVANANIGEKPATTTPVVTPSPKPATTTATSSKPVTPTPAPKPVTRVVYPPSDPNGYTDLAVTTLGSGIIRNGAFSFTASYERDAKNAIRFDVKNVGTKTSDEWYFKTLLPSGETYTSPTQAPLKPYEHIEFTLGFDLDTNANLVTIVNSAFTDRDVNAKNDSAAWSVVVK
ncbi:MAG TPA: hypothetical protein VFS75_00755 [Candidatus Paceibacterota bacterium]|nr:hypothetical protein [Candidatus Paceibacterota bacterium]